LVKQKISITAYLMVYRGHLHLQLKIPEGKLSKTYTS